MAYCEKMEGSISGNLALCFSTSYFTIGLFRKRKWIPYSKQYEMKIMKKQKKYLKMIIVLHSASLFFMKRILQV